MQTAPQPAGDILTDTAHPLYERLRAEENRLHDIIHAIVEPNIKASMERNPGAPVDICTPDLMKVPHFLRSIHNYEMLMSVTNLYLRTGMLRLFATKGAEERREFERCIAMHNNVLDVFLQMKASLKIPEGSAFEFEDGETEGDVNNRWDAILAVGRLYMTNALGRIHKDMTPGLVEKTLFNLLADTYVISREDGKFMLEYLSQTVYDWLLQVFTTNHEIEKHIDTLRKNRSLN